MTFEELKDGVQALFPTKFAESLIYSDDEQGVDKIIKLAVKKACSKYEKIESTTLVGSQHFPRAASILKCTYTTAVQNSMRHMVWNTMDIPVDYLGGVRHYFGPDKFLKLWPSDVEAWVEFVVDSSLLTVEDLDSGYAYWTIEYANALLKIKEGYIGTSAVLTALPFEFNYSDMKTEGETSKKDLEETLEEMDMGTLGIRAN